MTKQKHSLLNRGPSKEWPKALDVPRVMVDNDPEPEPPIITPPVQTIVHAQPKSTTIVAQQTQQLPVTVVIVNFKTSRLLKRAYKSFRGYYPKVPMIVVDNGSGDSSTDLVRELGTRPHVSTIIFDHNVGHGPAMNKAIQQVETPYVFTLDTDTETIKGGFLEKMVGRMKSDSKLYALGWRRAVDRVSGVPTEWIVKKPKKRKRKPVAYIHPSAGMYRVSMYHTLAPFFHHGAPCLNNMREADKRELTVSSFPIREYVKHLEAGTRRMYSGRWDPTNKTPRKKWRAKDRYPI